VLADGCNSRPGFKEEFPQEFGSGRGTVRQPALEHGNTSGSLTWAALPAHLTLRRLVLFANLIREGKESIMTTTRPAGCSVFLVEDEVMIRMMVADMLEELGHSVAAEAGDINQAVKLAQSTDFDLAILDVNVNGKVITPVAELINARHRPFIFATGYGSSGLPEEYRDRPALQKPFQLETLAQVIASTLKSAPV
jgi:CheY-like chemotaxis protein